VIYHGVRFTPAGALYRIGLALLDLENPRRLIRRGEEFVFHPEEPYERAGDVPDVVFPRGAVLDDDGDTGGTPGMASGFAAPAWRCARTWAAAWSAPGR
jgi:hypothetical protein